MSKYAILGATGSTGGAVLRHLHSDGPQDLHINIFVRSKSKLSLQHPWTSSASNITVTEGNLTDTAALQSCLSDVDAVFCCIASNESRAGMSVAQDTAKAITAALAGLKQEKGTAFKPPTVVVLSSAALNPKFSEDTPWPALYMLKFALHYLYQDLELSYDVYKESASDGLLEYIFAEPPGLMDPDGTEKTGHSLSMDKTSYVISYADLGAAMCELAERREEYSGNAVGICATGKVKETWSHQVWDLLGGLKGRFI